MLALNQNSISNMISKNYNKKMATFIDLFCGIGGFHTAAHSLGLKCLFASDIDKEARKAYQHNYNIVPHGDIKSIEVNNIPDHDILFAGFPCQSFSIIGNKQGFDDPRGMLFFEIIRVIKAKMPKALILENVKQLTSINKGETLRSIVSTLEELGYYVNYKILNALNFGVPQKRERILIIATQKNIGKFLWPDEKISMIPLECILEKNPDSKYFVSEKIKNSRMNSHISTVTPSIWHENKSGNISSYPYSCALRAGASYNYLLVDGKRRLTPREMLRLQGFPDSFEIVCNDTQTRKQAGNAVPVPMITAVLERIINVL